MKALRTPDERFVGLPDYPFAPNYVDIDGLQMHYVDEGPRDAPTVLMLHGEPSWSFLYRHMIPPIVAVGYRAVAPDLIGFGKSDKPTAKGDYSFAGHVYKLGPARVDLETMKVVERIANSDYTQTLAVDGDGTVFLGPHHTLNDGVERPVVAYKPSKAKRLPAP